MIYKDVLKKAEEHCDQNRYRLTKPRLEVLSIIAISSKPLGAYEILEKLREKLKNPKPPTVYRAIEFWQEHGFIHRIESLNAFIACKAGHRHQGSQFMICDDCGSVIETHLCEIPKPLEDNIKQKDFKFTRWSFEIHGICSKCA